jgi:hypothetical protein
MRSLTDAYWTTSSISLVVSPSFSTKPAPGRPFDTGGGAFVALAAADAQHILDLQSHKPTEPVQPDGLLLGGRNSKADRPGVRSCSRFDDKPGAPGTRDAGKNQLARVALLPSEYRVSVISDALDEAELARTTRPLLAIEVEVETGFQHGVEHGLPDRHSHGHTRFRALHLERRLAVRVADQGRCREPLHVQSACWPTGTVALHGRQ